MDSSKLNASDVLFVFSAMWYNMVIKFLGERMVSKRVSKKPVTAEDMQLRDYELVLIINPEVEDEAFDTTIDNVNKFITERGGIISNNSNLK